MAQVAALTIVAVGVVGPCLRAEVRILALISELLLKLVQEHELVEVLLSMLHLRSLTSPRVEAAAKLLLQVVTIAAHVLKLLICSELVHRNPVRYVLVLGAKCTVSYKACGHPCVAQFSIMEEVLLILALVHE